MQLDVGVSPPANIMTFRPGLTYLTFDLDEFFSSDYFSSFFLVRQTDRQTDARRRIRAHHAWAQVGSKIEYPKSDLIFNEFAAIC